MKNLNDRCLTNVLRGVGLVAVPLAILFASGCSGSARSEKGASSEQPILNGAVDMGDPAVVALHANGLKSVATCTAEVISDRVLLTAAHCINAITLGFAPISFQVVTTWNVSAATPAEILEVEQVVGNPSFNPFAGDNDIALVLLKKPTSIAPLKFNRASLDGKDGAPVRIVGYGVTKDGDPTSANIKNAASVHLSKIDAHHFLAADLPTTQCHGDSGGPTLMTFNGEEQIIGVGWRTVSPDGKCDQGVRDTRVDDNLAFIDEFLALLGGSSGGAPPPGGGGAPPPGGGGGGAPPPGGGGASACPSANSVSVAIDGAACGQPGAFADGHCASASDCPSVCCSCGNGGASFAPRVCADGQCVATDAACACAIDDSAGQLCQ